MKKSGRSVFAAAVVTAFLLATNASVATAGESETGAAWEIWLVGTAWPALSDLEPEAGGSFDTNGYGLGVGVHWLVAAYDNSDLMLGIEGALLTTDSDIPVYYDEMVADNGYVALSAKWRVGEKRSVSFDAGVAFHMLEFTQIHGEYYQYGYAEFQSWDKDAIGGYVGMTWDTWAGRLGKDSGLSLGFEVHLVDYGSVYDEDVIARPAFGPDAGTLDGPLYVFQVGYSSR